MSALDDLVSTARAVVKSASADPGSYGLMRLAGGLTHDVFVPRDEPTLVVKVFRTCDHDEHELEWDALVALEGQHIAPRPVHFDRDELPVVVMGRVRGSSLPPEALEAKHAVLIGSAHRLVHGIVPQRRQVPLHPGLRAARGALMGDEWDESAWPGDSPAVSARAWQAARAWFAGVEVDQLVHADRLRFSRGDPNLTNYLWSEEGLMLIDWEHSGYTDPALELADMAEHASTWSISEPFWTALADATELIAADRARIPLCRRAMACFWLVLIASRQRQGLPTTVTLREQALRTLAALDA